MIRVERCDGVCAVCEAATGSRTLVSCVRMIVASPSGGSGGARNVCEYHARQFLGSMLVDSDDAPCSSCGGARCAVAVLAFTPRKVRVCRQRCADRMAEMIRDALTQHDGWACDWAPSLGEPQWGVTTHGARRRV